MQDQEVQSGLHQPRTRENQDSHVQEVIHYPTMARHHGAKRVCRISEKSGSLTITQLSELNDVFPLSSYQVKGKVYVTLKRYIC